MSKFINKTARSPLLHFLLIGAAIYLAYGLFGTKAVEESDNTVVVTSGELEWLTQTFTLTWNRAPTPQEIRGLLNAHIRERVFYREAMAMGLDEDDVIVRRRLAQKLEFLFQDLADIIPPTEAELVAYFQDHLDQYQEPEVTTFTHVYVNPDLRDEHTLEDAAQILAQLKELEDPKQGHEDLGDRFMLQRYYQQRTEMEIGKLFGQDFTKSLRALSPGQWHGPVLSGYGVHLIYIHDRSQIPPPDYEAVQVAVREDWQTDRRQAFNEEYTNTLLARYEVIIEGLEDVEGIAP